MLTERRILLALFAIALGLRVLYGAILTTQPGLVASSATSDLSHAKEIASGVRWITEPYSPRAPGYPVVLAALYLLSVKQLWLVAFYQAILGALTVLVVYRLGRLFLGTGLATIAALWFALHVYHIHLSYSFERDIAAVLLLMLVLLLVVRPFKRMRYALIAGLVCTALIHVDSQYLLLLPVFALFVLFKTRHGLFNIQYLLLFLSVVVVASIPWTVRNYAVYGQPLPIGLEAARFLRPVKVVVTEPSRGISDIESKVVRASRARLIEQNTVEFWRFARFRGEQSPEGTEASNTTAGRSLEPAWSVRHDLVSILNYGVLLPFFLIGIVVAIRERNRTGLMLAAVTVAYFLMRAYLGGNERTRLPIDPLVVLIAFYGVAALVRRFRREAATPR